MLRVTCAVILFEGKVFAARRKPAARHSLKWEFPGGKVEPGESDQACLERELWEELEMQVEIAGRLLPLRHHYEDFTIELIPFVCRPKTVHFILKEHGSAGWFSAGELELLQWADADRKLLDQVLPIL